MQIKVAPKSNILALWISPEERSIRILLSNSRRFRESSMRCYVQVDSCCCRERRKTKQVKQRDSSHHNKVDLDISLILKSMQRATKLCPNMQNARDGCYICRRSDSKTAHSGAKQLIFVYQKFEKFLISHHYSFCMSAVNFQEDT